jgi:hypothetical protein
LWALGRVDEVLPFLAAAEGIAPAVSDPATRAELL